MRPGTRNVMYTRLYRTRDLKRHAPDIYLLLFLGTLLFFGLIMLWSATSVMSFAQSQTSSFYLRQQLVHGIIPGLVLFFIMYKLDYSLLRKLTPLLFFADRYRYIYSPPRIPKPPKKDHKVHSLQHSFLKHLILFYTISIYHVKRW